MTIPAVFPATQLVIDWIAGLGWDGRQEDGYPLVAGPYVPNEPDRLVIVTATPGAGLLLEGAADSTGFQLRVRGPQQEQNEAEATALGLDRMILRASFPTVVDGVTIMLCDRLGGAPSPLAGTPDDAGRWEYVSNYLINRGV